MHRPFFHAEALRSTGVAPLPRYYDLIRLLRSLSLVAVLPSSLAELSGSAAPFAPRGPLRSALPSPPATSPPGFALRRMRPLTPKSSRCGGVGFTHTETLTTRKHLTRLYVGSSLALRPIPLSGKTPAHRSRTRLRALRVAFGEVPSERLSPFCGASLHGLLGPSGYPLASLGPHCVRRVCPNRTSISLRCSSFRY